jgi:cytochrome c oxidase accessory protein FixG
MEIRSVSSLHETNSALLDSPEHVLSTLEKDGSRRWLWPRLAKGKFWFWRRWLGYALIAFFVALPHLRVAGKPALLLDIAGRRLIVVGYTFLPTDTLLLAFGIVSVFLVIMLTTALSGRIWCGWVCPQTVYMEFLFRPIDRWFENTTGRGGTPRRKVTGALAVVRYAVYLLLSMLLAHTFLSYFVGTDRLAYWIQSSPVRHPLAFFVMTATTVAMMFDFLFFREQLCLIACPYGRFQSVMLDRFSLIVGYDIKRGEPRGKLKKGLPVVDRQVPVTGDCIDCKQCVVVCPTGIDIRDGLQMECINCTQCIDACDDVMEKIGKPKGLVRYSSQDALSGRSSKAVRPRTILYAVLLLIVGSAFSFTLLTRSAFDAVVMRGSGNPYTSIGVGRVYNSLKLRLVNRSGESQRYQIAVSSPQDVKIDVMQPEMLSLKAGDNRLLVLTAEFSASLTKQYGSTTATMMITDEAGRTRSLDFQLLGPKQ